MNEPTADEADEPSSGDETTARPPARGSWPVRTIARIALAVIVVGVLIVGAWVALDLLSVRGSLHEARGALDEARGALGDVDLDAAASELQTADTALSDARARSGRVTWSVATTFPFAGPTVQVTRDVVEVASAAVEIAELAVADGQQLLGEGLEVEIVDGQVDLAPVIAAQQLLASLPIDRLATARDDLAEPRNWWLPEEVRQGRADTLTMADETLELLERGRALTEAIPPLFGTEGPRRYFVGVQTSAELRGTGGLIGFWGVLAVDDGRVEFGRTEDYDPFDDVARPGDETRVDRIRSIGLSQENPPDVDPAFFARYGAFAAARSFPNVNLDPDLPTTSKAILDLFELQTGERLDGVILLDPPGLQRLLEATGSTVPIGAELEELFGFDDGLPVSEFTRFVTADIYATLGFDRSGERNDALRAIGDAAFLQVFQGGWEGRAMASAVVDAASQRHLQVFTTDAPVQEALHAVNATGSLEQPDDADLFAITANNVVGGKQDVHLGHGFTVDVRLGDVRQAEDGSLSAHREASFTATVDNPLPSSGMDTYIIGSCYVPEQVNRCFEGDPGTNRTWFSLWAPPDTRYLGFDSDDGTRPRRLSTNFRDLRVYEYFLVTPSHSRASFTIDTEGRAPLRHELESVVYELHWWRQAKAIPDLLDVRISAPDGWAVGEVEVVGGGDGRGQGVHGDGDELTADVIDGSVVVRGTATADTRVRVHLIEP